MAYQPKSYRKFLATGVATAMVATAVAPAVSADEHVETSFTDVPEGSWYADNLAYTVERGIIEGYADNTFRPDGQITRAEAAAVLTRAKDLEVSADPSLDFSDTSDSQWYAAYVDAVVEAGYMQGDPGGTFRPNKPMSRGEFATVMVNAFDLERNTSAIVDFSDLDPEDSTQWYYDNVMTLASLGIVGGFTDGTFRAENNVNRAEATAFVHRTEVPEERLDVEVDELEVSSVRAVNGTTVEVNFNQEVEDVDFTNFEVSNRTVTSASLSSDGRTATVNVNRSFTREQQYTIESSDISPVGSQDSYNFENTFVWSVEDGVSVSLSTTSIGIGDRSNLEIKDENDNAITNAGVTLTSSNTNIAETGEDNGVHYVEGVAEGEVEITSVVTLADGSTLRNTFTVTVEAVDEEVENQGFHLVEDVSDLIADGGDTPHNTAHFELLASQNQVSTSFTEGVGSREVAMFDTVNGDPQTSHIDFDEFDNVEITDNNPTVATSALSSGVLTINARSTGTASFTIEMDGDEREIEIEVLEDSEQTGISLSRTAMSLSDESRSGTDQLGVNVQTVNVNSLDQYDNLFNLDSDAKVTATVNSEALELGTWDEGSETFTPLADNELDFGGSSVYELAVRVDDSEVDGDMSARIDVNFFEDGNDDSFTQRESVSVDISDIDTDATITDLDVTGASTIDAFGDYLVPTVATEIDFDGDDVRIYATDSSGNRIELVDLTESNANADDDLFVTFSSDEIAFTPEAIQHLTGTSTLDVAVTASGVTKTHTVTYQNSANVPDAVEIATAPISITTDKDELSLEEMLFGILDTSSNGDLIIDDNPDGELVGIKSNATNNGYEYNTPLVTVYDNEGNELPLGSSLIGLDTNAYSIGNVWTTGNTTFGLGLDQLEKELTVGDAYFTNTRGDTNDITVSGSTVDLQSASSGDSVRFTLVVEEMFIDGAAAVDADALNLLDSPVVLSFTVTKQ